jgi:hypothetical protein
MVGFPPISLHPHLNTIEVKARSNLLLGRALLLRILMLVRVLKDIFPHSLKCMLQLFCLPRVRMSKNNYKEENPGTNFPPEAEFLDIIGSKVLRVFLLAIHRPLF